MYGRNGEAPIPVIAPRSPADCFDTAIEAARIATKYRTPVILLSDGYLANGSEPWQIPRRGRRCPTSRSSSPPSPNHGDDFWPYLRDPETLARPWAVPGTPGLEHRIGGLEKADGHGNISYDPTNHDFMVRTRQAKVDGIARDIPPLEVDDPSGSRAPARDRLGLDVRRRSTPRSGGPATAGGQVAQAHLRHLNPFPANTGEVLRAYDQVLVPEMNLGQLSMMLRAPLPRRRRRLQPGPRPAVQGRGARRVIAGLLDH